MKRYVLMFVESEWHSLNIDDHNEYFVGDSALFKLTNILVTFQASDLIRYINAKRVGRSLPNIIDLECFDKQMSQVGKEFRDYRDWRLIHFLRHHKIIDSEFEFKVGNYRSLLERIASLFITLFEKDEDERERFIGTETYINKIIYQRQSKGVRIDLDQVKKKCAELEKEIYTTKNILQLEHNIFSADNDTQQKEYLKLKKYNIIQSPLYSFKVRRNDDQVCQLFYDLIRNEQDLDSCLFMLSHWGGAGRTFPTYLGFGTITSRITMRQPSLQNLRKINRSVIIPDDGKKFLYIDYSQFEAGILASLSGDELLIELYNSDIYSDLAEKVLGDRNKRSDAKIIFYRYMYGDQSLSKAAVAYFLKFKKLEEFRQKVNALIKDNKRVGTVKGNYRYALDENYSWSLSHIIQATASFIYKKSLIRTKSEVHIAEFLIPMHDGSLYQIEMQNYDIYKPMIEEIYLSEFRKICPNIKVKVTCVDTF